MTAAATATTATATAVVTRLATKTVHNSYLFCRQFIIKLLILLVFSFNFLKFLVIVHSQFLKSLKNFFDLCFRGITLFLKQIHLRLNLFIVWTRWFERLQIERPIVYTCKTPVNSCQSKSMLLPLLVQLFVLSVGWSSEIGIGFHHPVQNNIKTELLSVLLSNDNFHCLFGTYFYVYAENAYFLSHPKVALFCFFIKKVIHTMDGLSRIKSLLQGSLCHLER